MFFHGLSIFDIFLFDCKFNTLLNTVILFLSQKTLSSKYFLLEKNAKNSAQSLKSKNFFTFA